jgi:hypothetical protein
MIRGELPAIEIIREIVKRGHRCNKGLAHSWVDWPTAYQSHWGGSKCSTLGSAGCFTQAWNYYRSCLIRLGLKCKPERY